MDVTRTIIKLFGAKAGSAIVVNFGLIYFARSIGPEALGSFFLFQTAIGLLSIPADFGIRGALEKRLSEGENRGQYLSTALLIKVATVSFVVISVVIATEQINEYIGNDLVKYLIPAIILQELSLLYLHILHGEQRVGETSLIRLTRQVVWVFGGVVFITVGVGGISVIYSFLLGLVVMLIWCLIKVRVPLGRPSLRHAKSLFDFSKYNFISSGVGWQIFNWTDVFFIGLFLSQSMVSAYELSWRVSMLVLLVTNSVAATIFPHLSKLNSEGKEAETKSTIKQSLQLTLFISIPAFVGGALLGHEILSILFGSQYTTASFALSLLLLEKVFRSMQAVYGRALQAFDRPDLLAGAMVVSIVLNIIFNYTLVPSYGITGAAIATLGSFIANTAITTYFMFSELDFVFPIRVMLASILAATVMGFSLEALKLVNNPDSIVSVLGHIIVGVIIYFIAAYIIPTTRKNIMCIGLQSFEVGELMNK